MCVRVCVCVCVCVCVLFFVFCVPTLFSLLLQVLERMLRRPSRVEEHVVSRQHSMCVYVCLCLSVPLFLCLSVSLFLCLSVSVLSETWASKGAK